jgi:hypothetical protein
MTNGDYLRSRLLLLRPTAKFVEIIPAHSHPEAAVPFHHASLYDERIDLQFMQTPRGPVLVDNTYLGSFAYNLLTCWLYSHPSPGGLSGEPDLLLKHNFKKFYAEQLLSRHNNCFSRAIFLETLLYEQQHMVPVFAARESDATLDARISAAATLMTGLTASHELGHHFCDHHPGFWDEFLAEQPVALREWFQQAASRYPPAFLDEMRCDWIACHSTLLNPPAALTRVETMRGNVFGFAAFAVLYSLEKSATATATDQAKTPDEVDLRSIAKRHHGQTYILGRDKDFIERARCVRDIVNFIAEHEGLELYTPDGAFPLPEDILDHLLSLLENIMDSTDSNARSMSMLVAEALHGHEAGSEYLYLRSKVFTSNRTHLPEHP